MQRPFGGPEHVLRYLGSYTHRVAISNHRLVSLTNGQVTFRWRDSAHHNQKRLMTLPVEEFLRRFLLHLLPPGFVRIRNFGFLANRRRAAFLPFCSQLLNATPESVLVSAPAASGSSGSHFLDVSSLRWTHASHRTAHRGPDPTPFSTRLLHMCRMKSQLPARTFPVFRHEPAACVSAACSEATCTRCRSLPRPLRAQNPTQSSAHALLHPQAPTCTATCFIPGGIQLP